MSAYVALLRGVNVGGKAILKMADLRLALEDDDIHNVATYIQSGNVLFDSTNTDKAKLAQKLHDGIALHFNLPVDVVVFSHEEWREVIAAAPAWWGQDATWKHNLLIMIEPFNMQEIVTAYGALKPELEHMEPGAGVLYQSLSFEHFSRTTGGKLAAKAIYKKMTVRNFNTSQKLLTLLDARSY